MKIIKWTKSTVSEHHRTEKFGNLLSDTYQGDVYSNNDSTWSGWLMNLSQTGGSLYRFDFISKRAAIKWVNSKLRKRINA
jgi:hypothetical protein